MGVKDALASNKSYDLRSFCNHRGFHRPCRVDGPENERGGGAMSDEISDGRKQAIALAKSFGWSVVREGPRWKFTQTDTAWLWDVFYISHKTLGVRAVLHKMTAYEPDLAEMVDEAVWKAQQEWLKSKKADLGKDASNGGRTMSDDTPDKPWRAAGAKRISFDDLAARAQYEWQRAEDAEAEARHANSRIEALTAKLKEVEAMLPRAYRAGVEACAEKQTVRSKEMQDEINKNAADIMPSKVVENLYLGRKIGAETARADILALPTPTSAQIRAMCAEKETGR